MNGIDNPSSTIENETKVASESVDKKLKRSSPSMMISLTLHSLGIIFGDM
jgi:hypothetical protein